MVFLIYLIGAVVSFALVAYYSYTEIDVKNRDYDDRREAAAKGGFFGVLWPIALPVAGSVMLFNYAFDKVDGREVKKNAQELELMKLGILSKFSKDIEKLEFDKNLVTNAQERYVFENKVKSEFRRFERDYVRETPYGSDLRRDLEHELYELKNGLLY
jgi:hypothetical protein